MVTGIGVLAVAFGAMIAIWVLVLYGSTYFGPK